ncbi:MAG: hypothetical protein WCP28_13690 [Actinomycetes bacterium]
MSSASIRSASPRVRRLATGMAPIAAAAGVALLLSACGSSSAADNTAATSGGQGGNQQQRTPPGANGLIAEVTGTTLQVQGTNSQTAVTYSASTTITKDVTVTLAGVKVGQCVNANGTPDANGGSALTATNVRISDPVNGVCTGGFGDPNGGQPGGQGARPGGPGGPDGYGGQRPSGAPSGMPSGGPPGGQGFAFATGKVTSTTATTIVLTGRLMARGPAASASPADVPVTVTVGADTKYNQIVKATPAALVVGQCARAIGPSDTKGILAATMITVTTPVNGVCETGFGGRGRPGDSAGGPTGGTSGA